MPEDADPIETLIGAGLLLTNLMTELVEFRRATGENYVAGLRGATGVFFDAAGASVAPAGAGVVSGAAFC